MKRIPMRMILSLAGAVATPCAAQNIELPPVSPEIAVQGHRVVKALLAVGEQAYTCSQQPDGKFVWGSASVPTAYLYDPWNYKVGTHGFHQDAKLPFWKLDRGGEVIAKPSGRVDSGDRSSIPWVRLDAQSATGGFDGVRHIQRVHTGGGRAPATGCGEAEAKAKKAVKVGYTATYIFWAK